MNPGVRLGQYKEYKNLFSSLNLRLKVSVK